MTDAIAIREVDPSDAPAVTDLLTQLGYPGTAPFLAERLRLFAERDEDHVMVATLDRVIVGLCALHFMPSLAHRNDFARIAYLCVSEACRGRGVGQALVRQAEDLVRARPCDRIEVHCHARRTRAHAFYLDLGYEESPKYFVKRLGSGP